MAATGKQCPLLHAAASCCLARLAAASRGRSGLRCSHLPQNTKGLTGQGGHRPDVLISSYAVGEKGWGGEKMKV